MKVFRVAHVGEQQPVQALSLAGIEAIAVMAAAIVLLSHNKIKSSELYLCSGFALVAMMKEHGAIVLPIAALQLLRSLDIGGDMARRIDEGAADSAAKAVLGVSAVALAASIVLTWERARWPGASFESAAEYIASRYEESGRTLRVITDADSGSFLEYMGVEDCFADARVELMSEAFNGVHDLVPEYRWFRSGVQTQALFDEYGDLDGYLEKNNVQFITLRYDEPRYPYLLGWIERSGDWSIVYDYGYGYMCVWERIGSETD